jgi:SAM-dependent methyltransferase
MVDRIRVLLKKVYLLLIKLYGDKETKFLNFISIYLVQCPTVLDIGCGPSPYLTKINKYDFVCGVDAFFKVCDNIRKNKIYDQVINAQVPFIPIKNKSFDAVVLFQVIEHLQKNEGYNLIQQVEEIANKVIVITTPNGFVDQETYDNNPFQQHKSGWDIDDFRKLGYSVYGLEGLKILYKKGSSKLVFPCIFWAKIINLGLFERMIRNRPKLAFQLIAIKEL